MPEAEEVVYKRFLREGVVVRVVRYVGATGLTLYPNEPIPRSGMADKIWTRLVDGEGIEKILGNCAPVNGNWGLGVRYYLDGSKTKIFRIEELDEGEPSLKRSGTQKV